MHSCVHTCIWASRQETAPTARLVTETKIISEVRVCVFVCVCIYICIYIFIHYIYIYIPTSEIIFVYIYTHIYCVVLACMYVYMHRISGMRSTWKKLNMLTMRTYGDTYIHTSIQRTNPVYCDYEGSACMHAYIHTYIYTYIHVTIWVLIILYVVNKQRGFTSLETSQAHRNDSQQGNQEANNFGHRTGEQSES